MNVTNKENLKLRNFECRFLTDNYNILIKIADMLWKKPSVSLSLDHLLDMSIKIKQKNGNRDFPDVRNAIKLLRGYPDRLHFSIQIKNYQPSQRDRM